MVSTLFLYMNKHKLFKLFPIYTYILIESIIYIIFMIKDLFSNTDTTTLKYFSIILVFIFVLSIFIYKLIKRDISNILNSILILIAILFTLLSDTFLLYLNTNYSLGVSFFIVVQISYFIDIIKTYNLSKNRIIISSLTRLFLFLIVLSITFFIDLDKYNLTRYLVVVVSFYIINLFINLIDSIIEYFKNKYKTSLIFTLGLLLFIMCDISVGLYNLFDIMADFMWLFYLPSQVLLSLKILDKGVINYEK